MSHWLKGPGIQVRLSQCIGKQVLTDLCMSRIYWDMNELPPWADRAYWSTLPEQQMRNSLQMLNGRYRVRFTRILT